jgi:alpha-tubulin suppressor-like RCC1 family protein
LVQHDPRLAAVQDGMVAKTVERIPLRHPESRHGPFGCDHGAVAGRVQARALDGTGRGIGRRRDPVHIRVVASFTATAGGSGYGSFYPAKTGADVDTELDGGPPDDDHDRRGARVMAGGAETPASIAQPRVPGGQRARDSVDKVLAGSADCGTVVWQCGQWRGWGTFAAREPFTERESPMDMRFIDGMRVGLAGSGDRLMRVLRLGLVAGLLALPGAALAQGATGTTLTSSPNPSDFGQAVTLTATVDAQGAPAATGNISFRDGGTEFALATLTAMGIGVADVSGGQYHSCALVNSGRVFCWGPGQLGQLGNGTTTGSSVPVQVFGITTAVGVSAGSDHSCAVLQGGTIRCWGLGNFGQLGNGGTANRLLPVEVSGITTAIGVMAGRGHSCAVLQGGSVQCWGDGTDGQLGNGGNSNSTVPVNVSDVFTAVSVTGGAWHSCAMLQGGTVQCWGRGTEGQLGNGTFLSSAVPVVVSTLTSAVHVSAGGLFSCAALDSGAVRCWGYNFFGQLGNGSTVWSSVPVAVTGIATASGVSANSAHSCALLASGAVQCWGAGDSGRLGNGDTAHSAVPVTVSNVSTAVRLATGESHGCVMLDSGAAQCWGSGDGGRLGNGGTADSLVPVDVSNLSLRTLASAQAVSSALPGGTRVLSAVFTGNGQLAASTGTTNHTVTTTDTATTLTSSPNPSDFGEAVTLTALVDARGRPAATGTVSFQDGGTEFALATLTAMGIGVADVSAGSAHSCALANSGQVFCWGQGSNGRLGNGDTADSAVPVPVSGHHRRGQRFGGWSPQLRGAAGGGVQCWGLGSSGQLGNGGTADSAVPVPVSGITDAVSVAAGSNHSCAVLPAAGCNAGATAAAAGWAMAARTDSAGAGAGERHHRRGQRCSGWLPQLRGAGKRRGAVLGLGLQRPAGQWRHGGQRGAGGGQRTITDAVGVAAGTPQLRGVGGRRVQCWGWNIDGRLGNGGTADERGAGAGERHHRRGPRCGGEQPQLRGAGRAAGCSAGAGAAAAGWATAARRQPSAGAGSGQRHHRRRSALRRVLPTAARCGPAARCNAGVAATAAGWAMAARRQLGAGRGEQTCRCARWPRLRSPPAALPVGDRALSAVFAGGGRSGRLDRDRQPHGQSGGADDQL